MFAGRSCRTTSSGSQLTPPTNRVPAMISRPTSFSDSATLRNRTLRHYLRTPRLLVVAAGQPILFMIIFDAVFRGLFATTHRGSYIEYLVPGILIQAVVFAS